MCKLLSYCFDQRFVATVYDDLTHITTSFKLIDSCNREEVNDMFALMVIWCSLPMRFF